MTTTLLVAASAGSMDFIVGLLVGVAAGFLLGPTVRSWLVWREWAEASRRVRLTDEVLARMERDVELPEAADDPSADTSSTPNERRRSAEPDGHPVPPGR